MRRQPPRGEAMKTRVLQSAPHHAAPAHSSAGGGVATAGNARPAAGGSGLIGLIRRRPLTSFFVIAFALTWVTVPLGAFMAAGPLVAAFSVSGIVDGRPGLRELVSRILRWRVGIQWYAAAILIP